jgi:hypothetical protein
MITVGEANLIAQRDMLLHAFKRLQENCEVRADNDQNIIVVRMDKELDLAGWWRQTRELRDTIAVIQYEEQYAK